LSVPFHEGEEAFSERSADDDVELAAVDEHTVGGLVEQTDQFLV
jgi:hypothetical protein